MSLGHLFAHRNCPQPLSTHAPLLSQKHKSRMEECDLRGKELCRSHRDCAQLLCDLIAPFQLPLAVSDCAYSKDRLDQREEGHSGSQALSPNCHRVLLLWAAPGAAPRGRATRQRPVSFQTCQCQGQASTRGLIESLPKKRNRTSFKQRDRISFFSQCALPVPSWDVSSPRKVTISFGSTHFAAKWVLS